MCRALKYRHNDSHVLGDYFQTLIRNDALEHFFRSPDDQKTVKTELDDNGIYFYVYIPCEETGDCYLDKYHWWGVPWCETEREGIEFDVKIGGFF